MCLPSSLLICPGVSSLAQELHPLLRGLGGLGEGEAVEVYEEVKFEPTVMVDKLTPSVTLAGSQLEHGDILVFQRQLSPVGPWAPASGYASGRLVVMMGGAGRQLKAVAVNVE